MLKVGINSYFINTPNVGFGALTTNLIKHLQEIQDENSYSLYMHEEPPFQLEGNLRPVLINKFQGFFTELKFKTIWEGFLVSQYARKEYFDIFHSPYPSLVRPRAKKYIVSVLDVIYRIFPEYNITRKLWVYNRLTELVAKKFSWQASAISLLKIFNDLTKKN